MTHQRTDASAPTPVVAIGASAGGLKQISTLLGALPVDTGAAYVVVQHLSSERESQLRSLLARETRLPVVTIEDGMALEPDRVHVMPEDSALEIEGDQFRLLPKHEEPTPTVIDRLMRTLAENRGPQAVGIVLSGSGHDGALGLKAIKRHGGLTLVQDPETAEHDSMPRSARESTAPDFVLETAELVESLCNHLNHNVAPPAVDDRTAADAPPEEDDALLYEVQEVLRNAHPKHDFSAYKPNMLKRRIQRRIGLSGESDSETYLRRLREDEQERSNLAQDFLISVTDFFRDSAAYEALCDKALARILKDRSTEEPIRVWVPGCATGEETYSIAIALDEAIRDTGKDHGFIVFASDVDTRALEVARLGIYPESIAADVGARQLRIYFDKIDDHYRVKRSLREHVVFAAQNMIEDPPYSRLDLVSCRNLLMYLESETQKRAIATFHFALKPGGILFLGSSETVSGQVDLFEPLTKAQSLFRRIGARDSPRMELPFAPHRRAPTQHDDGALPGTGRTSHGQTPEQIARDLLLREFVPASVLVNRRFEILCSYGATGDFIKLPLGRASLSLMDMVRDAYRSHLRAIMHRAFRDGRECEVTAVPQEDGEHAVRLSARPLHQPDSAEGLVFVTFEHAPRAARTEGATAQSDSERQLADELEATRDELNATIQALEASNEDLKGSNEEILSMNEELQSTNEELETSKEELQSVNEELTTVNTELENKVAELETAHNDLQNLFAGTKVATLFLDKALCIKRFTPAIQELLSLINSDIGRPLSDISLKFEDSTLELDAERTLSDLAQRDQEVRSFNNIWYQRRIVPYRTQDNAIDGVVITFADISDLKRASLASAESEQRLDLAMGAIKGGMWDMHLEPQSADISPDRVYLSDRLKQLLGFEADQLPDSLQAWQERVLEADREAFHDFVHRPAAGSSGLHYRIRHRDGSIRWFASHGTLLQDEDNRPNRWIGLDRDITEVKLTDVQAAQSQTQLHLLADAIPEMVGYVDSNRIFQFVNRAFNSGLGFTVGEAAGRSVAQIFGETEHEKLEPCLEAALSSGRIASCHIEQTMADGALRKLAVNHVPQVADGRTIGLYVIVSEAGSQGAQTIDPVDTKTRLVYLQRMATIGEMTATLAHDIKQPLSAINNYAGALKGMIHAERPADQMTPMLGKIADQVKHASDMVSITRDFAGERDTEPSDTDLNTLIHRAVSLTEALARKHNVQFHLDLHTPLPPKRCVAVQIEQVIINLIVNAIDAMSTIDRDDRALTLRTRMAGEAALEVSVRDTGEGIPGEKLGRIFDSFYTSKLEGTGLGLSLSKSLIEGHGGTIWAESQLDDGATFFIRLPLNDASDEA